MRYLEALVDDDGAVVVCLDTGFLKAKVLSLGHAAGRVHDDVGLHHTPEVSCVGFEFPVQSRGFWGRMSGLPVLGVEAFGVCKWVENLLVLGRRHAD